jgi:serine O-acetyltransferase
MGVLIMKPPDKLIESDLYRYTGDISSKQFYVELLLNTGFRYSFILRKRAFYSRKDTFLRKLSHFFYSFLWYHYSVKYSIHIPPETKIGFGLYLGYGENIIVTGSTIIGNNVNINHGVTIGKTNRGNKKGAPIIGDCVWIGTNAVVVGNIIIGNNVLIAPLSHVNFDVPDNAVVAGNPAKIISYNGTEGYINKKWVEL